MPELVPVRVRDCACPDLPHAEEGDVVYLAPKISLKAGLAAQSLLSEGGEANEMTAGVLEVFIRYGYAGANFDVSVEDVLSDWEVGYPVVAKANEIYGEAFLRPLGIVPPPTSPGGQTANGTSARSASTRRQRRSSSA